MLNISYHISLLVNPTWKYGPLNTFLLLLYKNGSPQLKAYLSFRHYRLKACIQAHLKTTTITFNCTSKSDGLDNEQSCFDGGNTGISGAGAEESGDNDADSVTKDDDGFVSLSCCD